MAHHTTVEKGHNRQLAAKDGGAGLEEKQRERPHQARGCCAGPPVNSQPKPMATAFDKGLMTNAGGFRTITERTPQRMNSQTISEPVHTVVIATAANISHSKRTFPMGRRPALPAEPVSEPPVCNADECAASRFDQQFGRK